MNLLMQITAAIITFVSICGAGELRREDFSKDPNWDGVNNRTDKTGCRTTIQDFGYSPKTAHAGGPAGEMGGTITTAADLAYYAKKIKPLTFKDRITASGRVALEKGKGKGVFMVGFFNAENSVGWRTRNSLAMRLDARGGDVMHAHIEYATDKWRAGADFFGNVNQDTGKKTLREFPAAPVHTWRFDYDPEGNDGGGSILFIFDGELVEFKLDPGHKEDGATFNRFGLFNVMKSSDDPVTLYLDNLNINGEKEEFEKDPGWDDRGNRRTFKDCLVRPRFDFGYSDTDHAGGKKGELGGIVFRGDDRSPDTLAYYGDRLEDLTLDAPLSASGKVSLVRGITDSTVLIGWFHDKESLGGDGQKLGLPRNFLGIMIEGPSSEGFYYRAAYRLDNDKFNFSKGPYLYPNGKPHQWSLRFDPTADAGKGKITVKLDDESVDLKLERPNSVGASFNRFGIVTTRIDGHYQIIYFDDLEYTFKQ